MFTNHLSPCVKCAGKKIEKFGNISGKMRVQQLDSRRAGNEVLKDYLFLPLFSSLSKAMDLREMRTLPVVS